MLRQTLRHIGQTLIGLAVVLFFAAYGYRASSTVYARPSVGEALHRAWMVVVNTLQGRHLYAMYWGADWHDFLISLRLIAFAVGMAMLLGTGLAIWQARTRFRWVRQGLDILCGWLEAIPEALYVIVTIVVVVFAIRHLHVSLPVLPVVEPTVAQTWIPAISMAVPAGMYVWHLLIQRLNEASSADYVRTALSKGASRRRVFYRHVIGNTLPTLRHGFHGAVTIILSSVLFVEFYLEYTGAMFHFTDAVGWNMNGTSGEGKPRGVPSYQVGLTFELVAFLIICGALIYLLFGMSRHRRMWEERVTYGAARGHFQWGWVITGAVLLGVVFCVGTFPHLITPASPTAQHLPDWSGGNIPVSPPYPPSPTYPFGTDGLGRDLLARTLYSTWPTLWPAALATTCVIVLGMMAGAIRVFAQVRWFSAVVRWWSGSLRVLPVFALLFLALYNRNWHHAFALQVAQFVGWLVVFESGRVLDGCIGTFEEWRQFAFMEGVVSVGRRPMSAMWTHLRSWLAQFTVQFWFSEFARVLSLMTLLAAFHIYVVTAWGQEQFTSGFPPAQGFISAQMSWFQMLGDATNSMAYVNYPFILYAPVLALLVTTVGANLVVKGLRSAGT